MNKRTMWTVLMASTALAACGGGGARPQPTPTPPPTSTPAPTPTPPPPSGNTSLVNLQVSQTFATDAVTGTANYPAGSVGSSSAAPGSVSIAYDAANGTYSVTSAGRSQAFRPADRDAALSAGEADVYVRTTGNTTDSLSLHRPSASTGTRSSPQYSYVSGGVWQRTVQNSGSITGSIDAFTFGISTPNTALVRSGSGTYAVQLRGVAAFGDTVAGARGSGDMLVNFATGQITGQGTIRALFPNGSSEGDRRWQASALLSSTANAFSGTFGMGVPFGGVNDMSGGIAGRFYGPNAEELGASWSWRDSFLGTTFAGYMLGKDERLFPNNASLLNMQTDQDLADLGWVYSQMIDGSGGFFNAGEPNPHPGVDPDVRYSEADGAYVLNSGFLFANQVIRPSMREAAASDSSYDVYRFTTDVGGSPRSYTVRFFRPGAANPILALNYASFLRFEARQPAGIYTNIDEGFIAFGLPTGAGDVPTSGSGTYDALVIGQSNYGPLGTAAQPFDISGQARLVFNFAAGSLSGYMDPVATLRSSGVSYNLGRYDFTNTSFTPGATTFNGQFSFDPDSSNNFFNGQFMGPEAQELIARWHSAFTNPITGQRMPMFGIWAGRRTGP